jgi:hypothetical protein
MTIMIPVTAWNAPTVHKWYFLSQTQEAFFTVTVMRRYKLLLSHISGKHMKGLLLVELSKKQAEFWAFIIIMCTAAAIAVLLLDFGIKSAILEESTRLRLLIEGEEVRRSGHKRAEANANGATNDAPHDAAIPSDVLVVDPLGMEAGDDSNGAEKSAADSPNRRAQSGRPASSRTIPGGDK